VTLEENVLRQKVTTDIATKGGQFDVLTIGTYEAPIWAKQGWLVALDNLGATIAKLLARFYDPRTGERTQPASRPHAISDYVRAAREADLTVERLDEHPVDDSLAAAYPRGARYVGWPMLLLMKLSRFGGEGTTWRSGRP